ncbi:F-box protein At1g60400-like [Abrus precatorius]|uniref:F-box protein At1g60400-like n=1 Tax=Abrus precatorius TaxID=3816 RepID=A0A8B8L7C5_ABRPR|nr:F-box protein At1g60400-like [Abrus precatorius]
MYQKRQKDIISTLPDEILCHILSFLPTNHAVKTSVLSKRWNPIWRSITTLDFDDCSYGITTYPLFVQSVYSVFLSRNVHQPIQTFRFKCCHYSLCSANANNFKTWVDAACQRRVEQLDLCFPRHTGKSVNLPCSILNCRTLVVLQLGVSFRNHSLGAEFKTLLNLLTAKVVQLEVPLTVTSNVQFLQVDWAASFVVRYEDIPVFHNLTHMVLFIDKDRAYLHKVVEVLKHCPKLRSLAVDTKKIPDYLTSDEHEDGPHDPQPVPECLSLHLRTCSLNNYYGIEADFQLPDILRYFVGSVISSDFSNIHFSLESGDFRDYEDEDDEVNNDDETNDIDEGHIPLDSSSDTDIDGIGRVDPISLYMLLCEKLKDSHSAAEKCSKFAGIPLISRSRLQQFK